MQIREAREDEYDEIYLMGFDVWNEGKTPEEYLEACRHSEKYAEGVWYVLTDVNAKILASLIQYRLSADTCGIGSIATPVSLRNKGYASKLITGALAVFERQGSSKTFLFSDIDPKFYEKFGFAALPKKHQQNKNSMCMVRGLEISLIENDVSFEPPKYF